MSRNGVERWLLPLFTSSTSQDHAQAPRGCCFSSRSQTEVPAATRRHGLTFLPFSSAVCSQTAARTRWKHNQAAPSRRISTVSAISISLKDPLGARCLGVSRRREGRTSSPAAPRTSARDETRLRAHLMHDLQVGSWGKHHFSTSLKHHDVNCSL